MRIVTALALIFALGCTAGFAIASTVPPQTSFERLPSGWSLPRDEVNGAVALSWRYRHSSNGWANSMPKNGIAVSVSFPPGLPAGVKYRPLKLVLPKKPAATLEGAPDTPQYRIHGRIYGHNVEIWVSIRRPTPTRTQLSEAQRVVSAIRFAKPS